MGAFYDSKSKSINDRGLKALFTETAKYASWLELEASLAQAQAELNIIPAEAAVEICKACTVDNIDPAEMDKIMSKIGHGFASFLKTLIKKCGSSLGKYLHYGVTTQNIQQSSQMLIAKRAHLIFISFLNDTISNLAKLAREHSNTLMAGRTHGRHALPITFGYKCAVWGKELEQALTRFQQLEPRVFAIMMGGAVGGYHSNPETGREVEAHVAELLGMSVMDIPSRNTGVYRAEYISALALTASTLHRIAEEVYHCMGEEFAELSEKIEEGVVGSSTMPQKINPKLAKGIIGNSQKLYTLIPLAIQSCTRPFEADSSAYMMLEGTFTEALELATEIFMRGEELTRTLTVDKVQMIHNATLTKGLINSEHLMMELAATLGKDVAHSLVHKAAIQSALENKDFATILLSFPEITFSDKELSSILAPQSYTGLCSTIAVEFANKHNY